MKNLKILIISIFAILMTVNINAQKKSIINRDLQFNKLDQITTDLDTLFFLDSNKLMKRVDYTDFYAKLLNDLTLSNMAFTDVDNNFTVKQTSFGGYRISNGQYYGAGTSDDLRISWNTNGFIDNLTGELIVRQSTDEGIMKLVVDNSFGTDTNLIELGTIDMNVKLYENTNLRLTTSSTGVDISGLGTSTATVGDITSKGNTALLTKESGDEFYLPSQKEVVDTYSLTSLDNGKTIWLNKATAFNVTVTDPLPDDFECYFYNVGVGTVTFVQGVATTLDAPSGFDLTTDNIALIIKKQTNNDYKLKGELE